MKTDLNKVFYVLSFCDEHLIGKQSEIFYGLSCLKAEDSSRIKLEVSPTKQSPKRVQIPLKREN